MAENPQHAIIREAIKASLWEQSSVAVSFTIPDGDLRGVLTVTGHINTNTLADAVIETLGLTQQFGAAVADDPDAPVPYFSPSSSLDEAREEAADLDAGYVVTNWVTKWERHSTEDRCARCGRTDAVFGVVWTRPTHGSRETMLLCHGNPDGTKADPDCYHIVTTGGR